MGTYVSEVGFSFTTSVLESPDSEGVADFEDPPDLEGSPDSEGVSDSISDSGSNSGTCMALTCFRPSTPRDAKSLRSITSLIRESEIIRGIKIKKGREEGLEG